ncbi:MAG: hypothetical protein AAGJ46_18310 [Planctomycetota bacterium]
MRAFSRAMSGAFAGAGLGVVITAAITAVAASRGVRAEGLAVVAVGAGTLLAPLLLAIGITIGVLGTPDPAAAPIEPDETGHERY